jgi:hypothetical protein
MDQIEKKLSTAIQYIADLRARQAACEAVTTSLLAVLLSKHPVPLAALSAVRDSLTVQISSPNENDAQIVKLLTEQRVQDLIDNIETLLRQ